MTQQDARPDFRFSRVRCDRHVTWTAQKGSSSSPDRRHTAQPVLATAEPAPGGRPAQGPASETFGKQCTSVPYGTDDVCCRAEASCAKESSTLGGAAPTD
ncbi:hypothetical protein ALMP_07390 [Streptomyces sp. A012304]|nr:hypothetical protein ALMP_07390 [Streptomyces sp. A012304]